MKLSEKIKYLRKNKMISQEELAHKCSTSRQSISKWEMDIALPDTSKLIKLSQIFDVSIDVLLKDDLILNSIIETDGCNQTLECDSTGIYEGVLIKESIDDETILDYLNINKVELWKTKGIPRYWTVLTFSSNTIDLPEKLSTVLINDELRGGNWFVDFKRNNTKYIVFKDLVLSYTIGNREEKEIVIHQCREQGILDSQMKWKE
jgi:transcriptional regulator with XRE-family HTH domain